MARISLSFLRSALALFRDKTAQMAAGSHPIRVICKMRQTMPVSIFPRTIKDRKGRRIASNMIFSYNILISKIIIFFCY